jgi:hypothetical protein
MTQDPHSQAAVEIQSKILSGCHTVEASAVPVSNTEVGAYSADGTASVENPFEQSEGFLILQQFGDKIEKERNIALN